jgi:translation initiation factor IF-2
VIGLNGTPTAGDDFVVVENEAQAREIAEYRQRKVREKQAAMIARGTVNEMLAKIKTGDVKELPVLIKSDVHGSLEAIKASLEKMSTSEVAVKVIHAAVGGINESDLSLATASKALVIGFNVRASPQAREIAKRDNIDIRYYSIIYNIMEDVKSALSGLLSPTIRERIIGNAAIRDVFNITKVGKVAGCMVTMGVVKRGAGARLLREDVVIYTGKLKTLKRFKDEVKEVKEGFECGMAFENYDDMKVGDVIECYETDEIARTLD